MTHDDLVDLVIQARDQADRNAIARAFVASLSRRREDWRSPLGSLAVMLHLHPHPYRPSRFAGGNCLVCGLQKKPDDLDSGSFPSWRAQPGKGAQTDLRYAALDLVTFRDFGAPEPLARDADLLQAILSKIQELPPTAQLRDLRKALVRVFPSNDLQRWRLLEVLGYCGVLCPPEQPSYLVRFVGYDEREDRQPSHPYKREWVYPVQHWTGEAGVNMAAARYWLGPQLGSTGSAPNGQHRGADLEG